MTSVDIHLEFHLREGAPVCTAAVTGLGATTPLGGDVAATWSALLAGESGAKRLTEPWTDRLAVKIGAPLRADCGLALDTAQARRLDRNQQMALLAAREAWRDAGSPPVEAERLAVVIGTGLGAVHTFSAQQERLDKQRPGMVSPYTIPMIMPNGAAAVVSLDLGARAGAHAPMSACASGAEAIAIGLGLIRAGRADVVIAGGVEASLHPLPIAAFTKMGALSKRNDSPESASRPFDVSRDGFVMAEGAGIVVLERPEFAVARQANVYGTLAGTGVTSDAFHMTSPDSTGQCRAIQTALGDAALSPADISHVNAHATGTRMGDQTEALSIAKAIGTHPSVAATKAQTGHLIGAAGAVEAIFTILTIANGVIPASRNLDKTDVGVPIDVVSGRPRAADVPAAISSSFGFGGHSVVLVFTK